MSDLIDTTEMYLKTVYELREEGITPMRARIAERLGHSGPTVSQTVARLERDGLMLVTGDRSLELTSEGMAKATRVMRKHRLAERLLVDVIGLEWPQVHDEACRWEHVMSTQVERKLIPLLNSPQVDPYGNPIPGLGEFGIQLDGEVAVISVVQVARDSETTVVLERIGEPLQVDIDLLAVMERVGVVPGAELKVRAEGDMYVFASGADEELEMPQDLAKHLFVVRQNA